MPGEESDRLRRPHGRLYRVGMDHRFEVDGNKLTAHLALPARPQSAHQAGVVIVHGFPSEAGGGINSTNTLPAFADLIAAETGFAALAYASRGVAGSEGNFSLDGWRRDLDGAVEYLASSVRCDGIWLIGFGTGGALAVVVASRDERVRGVAAVAAPADFEDWARSPRKLLVWAREVGVVRDQSFPQKFDRWAAEIRSVRAVAAAEALGDRALLVLHGSDDETVPVFDARVLADACDHADLRIIGGAAHHLRHDPRAVAVLLGWLERQRQPLLAHVSASAPGNPGESVS